MKKLLLCSAAVFVMGWAPSSHATTVEASINEGSSSFVTGTNLINGATTTGLPSGFTEVSVSALSSPLLNQPDQLSSTAINISTSGATAGTPLILEVTAYNFTSPTGNAVATVGYTANDVSGGGSVSVTEAAYIGTTPYALSGLISNNTDAPCAGPFTAVASCSVTSFGTIAGPYSLTEVFTISATGLTNTNLTIDIQLAAEGTPQTPLPGALPLFASGLAFLGIAGWRKRKKAGGRLTAATQG
jgi:hypothetical protein